jgi:hypothetical protein
MFYKLQPYLCLIIAIFLICYLVHDIFLFRETEVEERVLQEKEEEKREETLSRLKTLIELAEEKNLDRNLRDRYLFLNHKLNK